MKILGLGRKTRIALLLGMGALAIPAEALLLPEILDRRPACVQAQEWVAAHKDALPRLYDELASYPMSHRRAIFSNLPPETRADLWRENLSRFESRRELTADQNAFVQRAKEELITAENYRRGGPEAHQLRQAAARITELFLDDADRRVFVRLGPDEAQLSSFEGARLSFASRIRALVTRDRTRTVVRALGTDVQAMSYGTCTCNVEAAGYYPWECYGGSFNCVAVGCVPWQACGLFGYQTCTGCCCYWRDETVCNC